MQIIVFFHEWRKKDNRSKRGFGGHRNSLKCTKNQQDTEHVVYGKSDKNVTEVTQPQQ